MFSPEGDWTGPGIKTSGLEAFSVPVETLLLEIHRDPKTCVQVYLGRSRCALVCGHVICHSRLGVEDLGSHQMSPSGLARQLSWDGDFYIASRSTYSLGSSSPGTVCLCLASLLGRRGSDFDRDGPQIECHSTYRRRTRQHSRSCNVPLGGVLVQWSFLCRDINSAETET